MANFGGFNYPTFNGVNLKNSAYIRLQINENVGTFTVSESYNDTSRAWNFPNKSGTFPIMGTFAIQLPAIAATTYVQSTIATVSGIRTEDALTVLINRGVTAGYGAVHQSSAITSRILAMAEPGNGQITLHFFNAGAATGYVEWICSYLAMR